MGYLWYSAGMLDDFEVRGLFIQEIDSKYARTPPYCSLQNDEVMDQNRLIKYLPEESNEIWMSAYLNFSYMSSQKPTNILTAFNITTNIFSVTVAAQTSLIYAVALIGANNVELGWSNMAFDLNKGYQVEVHYIRHSSSGLVEIWLNGTLIFSFTGNTGNENTKITGAGSDLPGTYPYSKAVINYSDFIFTNQGRIGNKRPILLPLSDAGDANKFTYQRMLGNQTSSANNFLASNYTYILRDQTFLRGMIKRIFLNVNTIGRVVFGVFRKDSSGKYLPKKYIDPIDITILGEQQLIVGTNFEEIVVDDYDYFGFYCLDGFKIGQFYNQLSYLNNNDTINTCVDNYSGNGFLITNPTQFITDKYYKPCIYVIYETIPENFYETSKDITQILNGAILKEQQDYASFSNGDKLLCNINNITIECTSIKSVRISAKAQAGLILDSGDFLLKIADRELAQTKKLPTTNARVDAQFDGNWTLAEINAAQIGFTVKESDGT